MTNLQESPLINHPMLTIFVYNLQESLPKKTPVELSKNGCFISSLIRESFSLFFGVLPLNHVNSGVHHKNQPLHGKIKKNIKIDRYCRVPFRDGFGFLQFFRVKLQVIMANFPLYWLVYRDPYIGLFKNPHIIG